MSITGSCLEEICALGRGWGVPPCPSLGFSFPICNRTPLACVMPWIWALPRLPHPACQNLSAHFLLLSLWPKENMPWLPLPVRERRPELERDVCPHPHGGHGTTGDGATGPAGRGSSSTSHWRAQMVQTEGREHRAKGSPSCKLSPPPQSTQTPVGAAIFRRTLRTCRHSVAPPWTIILFHYYK